MFENGNWEKKKLQDVAKVFGRGKSKHRPRNWEGLYGGDYPFIQTGEVRNASKYISSYTQTYNEVGLAQSKLWKKGTICITIAANIAETAILDFDACIPDSIIGFEVDEKKADLNFAYYLLQYFKAELQKLGKGSAQDNINLGTFENQYFPFPTIKEQQNIVHQLDALRAETQKLEALYQQKIDDLEELK
ncbi:MAG: restriction endonuclease subunit S, partial [Flammeovirgaceae bacterium]